MTDRLADALDGMSSREAEKLRALIDKRLASCILDGQDGAVPVRCHYKVHGNSVEFSLLLCPACIEKHRLPRSRSA